MQMDSDASVKKNRSNDRILKEQPNRRNNVKKTNGKRTTRTNYMTSSKIKALGIEIR